MVVVVRLNGAEAREALRAFAAAKSGVDLSRVSPVIHVLNAKGEPIPKTITEVIFSGIVPT